MKTCIFDLDGTLTDTLESITYSVQETLKEMGLMPITKEQCCAFVGNGARVLIEKSLDAGGDKKAARIEEGMEVYGRIFDENCTYHVTPYDGIEELLKTLKAQGVKLAVLSNKPHRQTVKVVREILEKMSLTAHGGNRKAFRGSRTRKRYSRFLRSLEEQRRSVSTSVIQKWM